MDSLQEGDHLFFTDWRGDPDEKLRDDGPTVAELFAAAAKRGVVVKGLLWRSHLDKFAYSEEENRNLGDDIAAAGGEVLLDQRVRRGGSHHQKVVILRHPGRPELDVAFAGGIDLCHSRRDGADHRGDPQAVQMASAYGDHPPWHDVQLELHGPVVGALDLSFRERWSDPTPLDQHGPIATTVDKLKHADEHADRLPPQPPDPPECGPLAIQVLRTYPAMRPPYRFAPLGERTVARGYTKAIRRARRLIYVEDQYLWSAEVAELFAQALRDNPELHLVAVVPRHPDVDGRFALPPNEIGREQALELCRTAAADRVHVFDLENEEGTPIYVHAKVCVIDDEWCSVGSDNFNRRSWTHDSELSCAIVDPSGAFPRDLRVSLMREHLGADPATPSASPTSASPTSATPSASPTSATPSASPTSATPSASPTSATTSASPTSAAAPSSAPPSSPSDISDISDPMSAVRMMTEAADRLRAWRDGDRKGPRPPGRLIPHSPERLPWYQKLWALPAYRLMYDPDGRPWRDRRKGTW